MANNTMKVAYSITKNKVGRSFWNRIGVGFVNQDGSINIELFAVPVDGKIQLREYEPKEDNYDPAKASTSASRARKPAPEQSEPLHSPPDEDGDGIPF